MSQTRSHVVRAGECIESIAARYGLGWEELWGHGANAALRERRENPNVLRSGDVVHVPVRARRELPIQSHAENHFRAVVPATKLRLRLVDHHAEGRPRPQAGVRFRLKVGSALVEGETDGDGHIEATVPVSALEATLILEPGTEREEWTMLQIGHLDPIDERGGVIQRLRHLGLLAAHHGPLEPTDEAVSRAIAAFQRSHGLAADGRLTSETLAALTREHDG